MKVKSMFSCDLFSFKLCVTGWCIILDMLAYELGYSLKGIVIDYRWSCLVGYGHHICWLCLDIVLIVVNCLCMITWQMVAYKNICIPLMVISFSLYTCVDSYSEIRSYLHLQMLAFSHISSMVFLSLFSCIVVTFIFGGLKTNLSTAFFL